MPQAIIARIVLGLGAVGLIVSAVLLYGGMREREGRAKADAEWQAASARMQEATVRATNAAAKLARAREAEDAATIKDLENEAAKGTDDGVGPGIAGVLARLRAEGSR